MRGGWAPRSMLAIWAQKLGIAKRVSCPGPRWLNGRAIATSSGDCAATSSAATFETP